MPEGIGVSKAELDALRREAAKGTKLDRMVIDELAELADEHKLYVFRPETRCRVCLSDAVDPVNTMLAHAMTYADILRSLEPLNRRLPEDKRITYNSIRTHATRHFPIEETAKATYRRMVEKRAEQHDVDFVRGVGGALTPLAYLDVTMQKGFESLVQDDTVVSVETGLRAAEKLHELAKQEQNETDVAQMMLRVNALVNAVKAEVPEEMWERIAARVEGRVEKFDPNVVDAEVEEEPVPEVSGYDPGDPDFIDDDPEGD